jgi:hypothetical protein
MASVGKKDDMLGQISEGLCGCEAKKKDERRRKGRGDGDD